MRIFVGGVLLYYNILKIQKLFRGFLGRKEFLKMYLKRQKIMVNRIISLYVTWKRNRVLKIKNSEYLNNLVRKIQKMYHMRMLNKLLKVIRYIHMCVYMCICLYHIYMYMYFMYSYIQEFISSYIYVMKIQE
jgi:hypothetical protein